MKRIILSILSFILLISSTFSQEFETEKWKSVVKNNKIETQTQWNHKYVNGEPSKEGYLNVKNTYDKNGYIIEEQYFRSGVVNQWMTYEYDEEGNRLGYENKKKQDGELKILYKQSFTYDNNNNKTTELRFNGAQLFRFTYQYDGNKLDEIKKFDQFGKLEQTRKFIHNNNETTINVYSKNNKIEEKIINVYDDRGNIIETSNFKPANLLSDRFTYKFDDQNRLVEKVKYKTTKFKYKEMYSFDDDGNLAEVLKEEPANNEYLNNKYEYDTEGKLTEEQWYDNHPEKYSKKTYQYNDKGILEQVEVFYALYNYRILYKYEYEFY